MMLRGEMGTGRETHWRDLLSLKESSERNILTFLFFIHQCFRYLCPLSDSSAL